MYEFLFVTTEFTRFFSLLWDGIRYFLMEMVVSVLIFFTSQSCHFDIYEKRSSCLQKQYVPFFLVLFWGFIDKRRLCSLSLQGLSLKVMLRPVVFSQSLMAGCFIYRRKVSDEELGALAERCPSSKSLHVAV